MSEDLSRQLGMIYERVASIEALLRSSPLGEATRGLEARAAKVSTRAAPVSEGELRMLNGEIYMVRNGNVYEYDSIEAIPGSFVGRLRADETIDVGATEVTGGARKTRKRLSRNKKSRKNNRRH
jgi:hypothetical protein